MLLLLLIGGLLATAFYSSSFQTILAKKYLNSLQKNLSTTISIDNVDIVFFDDLVINNLYIEDQYQDTLLFVRELKVDINLFSLSEKQILLESKNLEARKDKISEILSTYSFDDFHNTTIQ